MGTNTAADEYFRWFYDTGVWKNMHYRGIRTLKVPSDLWNYQEILYEHDIDWVQGGKPFLTKRGRLVETLTAVVQKVAGVTPQINCTGGTSDGRFIFDICPEVAEFGPVNRSIHKVNEAVALDEIDPLVDVYRLAVQELLGPE